MSETGGVTLWLADLREGSEEALERLLPLVYDQLRDLANSHLSGERATHTLDATELVHEAYMRLSRQNSIKPENRRHFFGIASHTMRRILVDHARSRTRVKRGKGAPHLSLADASEVPADEHAEEILALNDALERLGLINERSMKVVELRYFAGLTHDEVAEVLGLSRRTVQRSWVVARAWIKKEVQRDLEDLTGSPPAEVPPDDEAP